MFSYSPGRGAQHAQKLYDGVQPGTVLMTDGYELYDGIAQDHQFHRPLHIVPTWNWRASRSRHEPLQLIPRRKIAVLRHCCQLCVMHD
ncbi:hypothetical protein WS85_14585 [Burkholderia anthina]|nr:hypothetical protein WS85_14585 [Burkholderia anthina]KVX34800.1 hypothetical protein WT32_18530 [Burkholderia anthina]